MKENGSILQFVIKYYKLLILVLFIIVLGFQFMRQSFIYNRDYKRTIKHYESIIDSLNTSKTDYLHNISILEANVSNYKDSISYLKSKLNSISNENEIIKYNYLSNDSVVITFNGYITKYRKVR